MINHLKNNKELIILSILMGSVVIISNYLVQFPFKHFNLNEVLTYGAFTYPISFLITDVSNQKFGNKVAKKVVYFGFFVSLAMLMALLGALTLLPQLILTFKPLGAELKH